MPQEKPPSPHYIKAWGKREDEFISSYGAGEVWFDEWKDFKEARGFALSLGLATDDAHGPASLTKPVAHVVLAHGGKQYSITDDHHWYGYPAHTVEFSWRENNYACDCNRSACIRERCDPDFPGLACGDTIELVSLEIEMRHRDQESSNVNCD